MYVESTSEFLLTLSFTKHLLILTNIYYKRERKMHFYIQLRLVLYTRQYVYNKLVNNINRRYNKLKLKSTTRFYLKRFTNTINRFIAKKISRYICKHIYNQIYYYYIRNHFIYKTHFRRKYL